MWEPEEQFQWIQLKKRTEKMDLKRAINRLETVGRRTSWQNTEQAEAIKVVVEAAKKQLPPEPQDTLTLLNFGDYRGWFITAHNNGRPLEDKEARRLHDRYTAPRWKVVFVKVPV